MTSREDPFDGAAAREWRAWQVSPWGRLRYRVAGVNLRRRIAALGDGTFADRPLERARRAGVERELRTVEAEVRALPEEVPRERFDVVLCHNVVQYVDDPGAVLRSAASLVRGGGLLSVMAVNRHAHPLSLAVRSLDPAAALEALDEQTVRGVTFGAELTLFTAEEITALMAEAGCREIEHCGIRCVNDHIVDDARKHDPEFYAALERLELALTDRHPYPHTAKIFQLLGCVPDVSGGG